MTTPNITHIICAITLSISFIAHANNPISPKYLQLWLSSGEQVSFPLATEPVITIEEGVMAVDTESYRFEEVSKYTFEASPALAITTPEADCGEALQINNGELRIAGVNAQPVIHLYDISGKELHPQTVAKDNTVTIKTAGLAAGAYVLTINGNSHKIIVK